MTNNFNEESSKNTFGGSFWTTEETVESIIILLTSFKSLFNVKTLFPTSDLFGEILSKGKVSQAGNSNIWISESIIFKFSEI